MKKLLFLLIPAIMLVSCDCGCITEEDPSTPAEQMSYVGKILEGDHYLKKLPGTDEYILMEESGLVKMFIKFGDQSVIHSFPDYMVIYEETFDSPHVRFRWLPGNEMSLNEIVSSKISGVVICIPKEL